MVALEDVGLENSMLLMETADGQAEFVNAK